jgi:hypothetical protein
MLQRKVESEFNEPGRYRTRRVSLRDMNGAYPSRSGYSWRSRAITPSAGAIEQVEHVLELGRAAGVRVGNFAVRFDSRPVQQQGGSRMAARRHPRPHVAQVAAVGA